MPTFGTRYLGTACSIPSELIVQETVEQRERGKIDVSICTIQYNTLMQAAEPRTIGQAVSSPSSLMEMQATFSSRSNILPSSNFTLRDR